MTIFYKTCKECGKEFETTSNRRMFCYEDHYKVCISCGNRFFVPSNKLADPPKTCSEACRRKAISASSASSQPRFLCVCRVCGKEFLTTTPNSSVCLDTHIAKCAVCGKEFELTHQQALSGTSTCSKECRYELVKRTNLEHWGCENPGQSDVLIAKRVSTNIERYGYENPMQNPEIAARSAATRSEKMDEIAERIRQGNLRGHGYEWPMKNPEIRAKAKQTCLERYGVDNYAKSAKFVATVLTDSNKAEFCEEFRSDPKTYIHKYFPDKKPTLVELADSCGMRDSSAGQIILSANCQDMINYVYSRMETEVYDFLSSILPEDIEVLRNTFRVIPPYELDIYIPRYQFAIECNPTITHNSTIPGFGSNDAPKPKKYHQMKTDLCNENDIFLFHIFGYEWSYKKEVIKSMISNILKQNKNIIYARNTEIREVAPNESRQFLIENHRQSGVYSKIRLGLYYQNSLVSLMTFSKMRTTIGTGLEDLSDCWELVRFCNLKYTSVVGGASKLFKYFVKTYAPIRIRSFSDRSHTRGNLYEILGFKEVRRSDPGYVWVDLKTDKGYARNNAQKKNLKKFLQDDSIDLTKTEIQIMEEHHFVQVFDSGTITWEWNR